MTALTVVLIGALVWLAAAGLLLAFMHAANRHDDPGDRNHPQPRRDPLGPA